MTSHILITGASGFIGQELAAALLAHDHSLHLILSDVVEPTIPSSAASSSSRITTSQTDLTSPQDLSALLGSHTWEACYLLHGIMSSGSEANLELGLRVNLDSHRACLDYLRNNQPGVKVVFPSSNAVYGPAKPGEMFNESTMPLPQSSYGTEKFMIELLLNDYSRRGLLDGRIVRLPTVIVRPGAPTAAASSFASGIVREPMKGEKATLPVDKELDMWVCSPRTVVRNLIHVKDVPKESFGLTRLVNLPGLTVKVRDILDALEKVGGKEKRNLVIEEKDPVTENIVLSWPTALETSRAFELGMAKDVSLEETVRAFADSLKR
ncbi:NAD dependent epimerase/dehydratase [Saccharata proteae CBS 121410]|uniref:NAD dependent epimerase/dehydratase n=1 Tax=Saccharata proteae CBS 121410 TaxID=1314787 RepID=A0A9P4LZJ2_9PEZI|nr:NAD dependent epimerase/dehydratase [Saccharata proteae CBS 121410]